jgi:hypothetical protein
MGYADGFFKAITRHAKAVNTNETDLKKNFSATEKFNMETDWIDKGVWLLKGFIIGAAMTAFMSFLLA